MDENIVYSLNIEFNFIENESPSSISNKSEAFYKKYFQPTIEKIIEDYGEKYNLIINNIDIDLGDINIETIHQKLENKLRLEIEKYIIYISNSVNHNEDDSYVENKNFFINYDDKSLPYKADILTSPKKLSYKDICNYLYSASIPWHIENSQFNIIIEIKNFVNVLIANNDYITQFINDIQNNSNALFRLLNLTSKKQKILLIDKILSSNIKSLNNHFIHSIYHEFYLSLPHKNSQAFLENANIKPEEEFNTLKEILDFYESNYSKISLSYKTEIQILLDFINHHDSSLENLSLIFHLLLDSSYSDSITQLNNNLNNNINNFSIDDNKHFSNRIHIEDAGLVLLHPFLTHFFSHLNLLCEDKKKFINFQSQERAAHLLKYITGYRGPHYEHLMMFEKLICNIPLNHPLSISFIPSKEEKEEIRNLLQTVCQYWKPLNNSSIESLQNSFILRHGTFEWMDPTWVVRVEGGAIDILLDDLPWEISTILLPWLESTIYVEWQTE